MRRSQRLIAAGVILAFCSVLAGCGGGGISSFDPTDLLDFLDTKKKLPGDRKPVFPEGVPGLEQGVPKDLYKGAVEERAREEQLQQGQAAAAAEGAKQKPKTQPKDKVKTKRKPAAVTPVGQDAEPVDDDGSEAAPAPPKPAKRTQRASPPQQERASVPAPQSSSSPFPAPLPSGGFSR